MGWDDAFSGENGAESLYQFNLLRETVFASKAVHIWWMSETFRDTFMRHAPDMWSFMTMRLSVAEADEYVELPQTIGRIVRSGLGLKSTAPIPRQAVMSLEELNTSHLVLSDNDVEAIGRMYSLKRLVLSGSKFNDLDWITHLVNLETLDISFTGISDITAIEKLKNLKSLTLDGTRSPSDSLRNLNKHFVPLKSTISKAIDLSPISQLDRLEYLRVYASQLTDLTILEKLGGLTELWMILTELVDLSALTALTKLRIVGILVSKVTDISPIRSLTYLEVLHLAGSHIENLTPIEHLVYLEGLDISTTPVSDIACLASLKNLVWLNLVGTNVTDVFPLAHMLKLKSVFLPDAQDWNPQLGPPPAPWDKNFKP